MEGLGLGKANTFSSYRGSWEKYKTRECINMLTLPPVGSSERQTHTGKCISLGGNVATPSLGE